MVPIAFLTGFALAAMAQLIGWSINLQVASGLVGYAGVMIVGEFA